MDLLRGISNLAQAQTLGQIQIAVARKILDQQEMQGQAALQLLEAATVGVTRSGDALIAAATGLGGAIDTYG